jgi:DNA-binding NarL/FixJ family response regulator
VCRDGLRQLLKDHQSSEIVGEADNGRSGVAMVRELRPDIALLEVNLPDLNGVETTRQLVAECPGISVIVVSVTADWHLVTGILRAGAQAFVLADGGIDEIEQAIRAVSEGNVYLSPVVETRVITALDRVGETQSLLTPREREVLQLIAEGKTTRQVADILYVSVKTVETHRRQIMGKLGIHSVAGLTKYAIRQGITTADH